MLKALVCSVAFFYSCAIAAAQIPVTRADAQGARGGRAIQSIDVNRDGWLDIAAVSATTHSLQIFVNPGESQQPFIAAAEYPVGLGPFDLAAADFNRDGFSDLAVANADSDSITMLLGRSGGTFRAPFTLSAPGSPRGIVSGDVDADGKLDLIFTSYSLNTLTVLFGDGIGGFPRRSAAVRVGARPEGLVAADFNYDGRQLWVRLKGDGNHWANDSIWIQFSGAVNRASGAAVYRIGSDSGLAVNLEECVACGIDGWGWRDDGWGTAGVQSSTTLRFPDGGLQQIRVQVREDGVSVAEIRLSAHLHNTTKPGGTRPGPAKRAE